MLIQRAFKVEVKPNVAQRTAFVKHAGVARFAFNWALNRRKQHYETTGKTISLAELDKAFNAEKATHWPWVYEVSKTAHQAAIRDCDRAFTNFWRDKSLGFPRFKSKHKSPAKFKTQADNFHVTNTHVRLARIGWVRLKRHGYIPTDCVKINSITLSERAGRWFVSVQVEQEIVVRENQTGGVVGIDLGLTTFAVGSDGSSLEPPHFLRKSLKRLKKLSRQMSRKVKGSANRHKAKARLGRLHYRISCQRSDWLHKSSHYYASRYNTIVLEDLNVRGMVRNHSLAMSISDSGWSEFRREVAYKSAWRGGRLVEADRFFPSTKRCSMCGSVKPIMGLSERTYRCYECGNVMGRDWNAARNLEQYGRAGLARTDSQESTPAETHGASSMQEVSLVAV